MSNAAELFASLRAGDTAEVARMLELEPALVQARNEQGISAVLMACYMGQKEIRDLLIEKGAHLELHEAAAAGNLPRVRELVEENSQLVKSYSPDGFPVMALSAAFGHEDVARYLHGKGAEINAVATNGTGYTALTGAVASSHGVPFIGFRGGSDGGGDPLMLPGFPFQFFFYKQIAADNAATATIDFLRAWSRR